MEWFIILIWAVAGVVSVLSPILMIVLFVFLMRGWDSRKDKWQRIAKRFGLTYSGPSFRTSRQIQGTVQSVPLRITTIEKLALFAGRSRNTKTYVAFQAWFPSHHTPQMAIQRETTLKKVFGSDIQVGDEELDKLLLINGPDASAVRALLLHPPVKQALLHCFRDSPERTKYRVERNSIIFTTLAGLKEERFCEHINRNIYFAKTIATAANQLFKPDETPGQPRLPDKPPLSVSADPDNDWW